MSIALRLNVTEEQTDGSEIISVDDGFGLGNKVFKVKKLETIQEDEVFESKVDQKANFAFKKFEKTRSKK